MQDRVAVLRSVTKRYGDRRAVDDVTLTLAPGGVLALLGPNGAGKTTLMRILCGLIKPDAGAVEIGAEATLGFCPQALRVWPDLTCLEQLVFMGQMHDMRHNDAKTNAERLLDELQMRDRANELASTLSGGLARRLSLALAAVHNPTLLVLDEPEAGLDPASRFLLRDTLARWSKEEGRAVLISTHDMSEAERVADRVAVMVEGRLKANDTPEALVAAQSSATLEDAFRAIIGLGDENAQVEVAP